MAKYSADTVWQEKKGQEEESATECTEIIVRSFSRYPFEIVLEVTQFHTEQTIESP